MAEKRRKAPANCYWREGTLYVRISVNGREHRESLRTRDPRIAERRAREIRERLNGLRYGEESRTWEAAVTEWAAHIAHAVKPSTAARYATSLAMVGDHFAGKDISRIGKQDITAMVRARSMEGASTATIRRDLTAIASVLSYAEDQDWREGNPALDKARRLKERRDPIVLPSRQDIESTIARLAKPVDDIARMALLTGARLNEIVTLQRKHVRDGRISLAVTKTSRGRTLVITDDMRAIIDRQPLAMTTERIFHRGGEGVGDVSAAYRRAVTAAQKTAQKEGRSYTRHRFHDLRHFFAVQWLLDGGSLYELQGHLGHTSIKTTEIYLSFLTPAEADTARQAARKAAQGIGSDCA